VSKHDTIQLWSSLTAVDSIVSPLSLCRFSIHHLFDKGDLFQLSNLVPKLRISAFRHLICRGYLITRRKCYPISNLKETEIVYITLWWRMYHTKSDLCCSRNLFSTNPGSICIKVLFILDLCQELLSIINTSIVYVSSMLPVAHLVRECKHLVLRSWRLIIVINNRYWRLIIHRLQLSCGCGDFNKIWHPLHFNLSHGP
jgi:hypothetical protein